MRSHFPDSLSDANALSGTQGLYFSTHAKIEESTIYPTNEQAIACLRVCQMLSNYYRNIELFRFDDQSGIVFIFAGEELQIIVPPNGLWRFLDATEL